MKTLVSRAVRLRAVIIFLSCACYCSLPPNLLAQTNIWTNSTSGNWEDSHWSLGRPPGTNQTILFTNGGWKALEIGSNVTQNFPQTMSVDSVTISSPPYSFNTLLLNYAGLRTPLEIGDTNGNRGEFVIGDNSAVIMLSSSLVVHDASPYYGAFSIAGTFSESEGSLVTAGAVRVGNKTSGVYNLTNSTLSAATESAGPGTFNQIGGTNFAGSIGLGNGDGTGSYTLFSGLLVASNGIGLGYYTDIQYYHLGYSAESYGSSFYQSGGFCTNGGIGFNRPYNAVPQSLASYELAGGILSTPSIYLNTGVFSQNGGTNQAGNISLNGIDANYYLEGGWLMAGSIQLNGDYFTGFSQYGGTNRISDSLSISNSQYALSAGQLIAQNIQLNSGGVFAHSGGTLNISGVLLLANGSWEEQTAGQQFGPLQLGDGTSSTVSFPTNGCVLQFADSSSLPWPTSSLLEITGWSGSLYGGGQQQIIFGANSAAITPQQLTQIQFQNPAGLPSGNYPARILATGEIVPDTGAPLPLKMETAAPTDGMWRLSVEGEIGRNYAIEVSTDLVHWLDWSTQLNASGTIFIDDPLATDCVQRFYRARLVP